MGTTSDNIQKNKDKLAETLLNIILGTDSEYLRFISETQREDEKNPQAFIAEILEISSHMDLGYERKIQKICRIYNCQRNNAVLLDYFTSAGLDAIQQSE